MNVEKTKELENGPFIEAADERTPIVPNEEVLEEKGLDYDYVIAPYTAVNGGEDQYWYHDTSMEKLEAETKVDGDTFNKKYIVKGAESISAPFLYALSSVSKR